MSRYRVVYARRFRRIDFDGAPRSSCSAYRTATSHDRREAGHVAGRCARTKQAFVVVTLTIYLTGDDMKEIEPTPWFELDAHTPVHEGWYEVQLTSGDTAFAKFGDGVWTEKPLLVFTHWRGLSADPSKAAAGETESISAEATAAQGVRAAWNAFFPGLGEEQHKPLDAVPNGKAPH
jgi:hypothetical protein